MNEEKIKKAVDLILRNILVSAIYLVEHNDRADFVYFCTEVIDEELIMSVETQLSELLGCGSELVDAGMFNAMDLLSVIQNSPVVYKQCEEADMYVAAMVAKAVQKQMYERKAMIERHENTGAFYLQ